MLIIVQYTYKHTPHTAVCVLRITTVPSTRRQISTAAVVLCNNIDMLHTVQPDSTGVACRCCRYHVGRRVTAVFHRSLLMLRSPLGTFSLFRDITSVFLTLLKTKIVHLG